MMQHYIEVYKEQPESKYTESLINTNLKLTL